MKGRRFLLLAGALALATLLVGGIALAQQDAGPTSPQSPAAALGTGFTYQGYLTDGSGPVNDTCDFTFGLYDEAGSGTPPTGGTLLGTVSEPGKQVSDGYFSVELEFGADDFTGDARYLQITVDCGDGATTLSPRQPLTAVPYALYALDTQNYAQVVVVAKSGGDYTSVQAAINSITDAAADKPYLVWVAPGVYNETVTMEPYVHLQGAGQEATIITSSVSTDWPPTQATLVLADHVSLRDLTVGNAGTGSRNVAMLATAGTAQVLVADVTARAQGSGTYNHAIHLAGGGTDVTLEDVTALGENGNENFGLYSHYAVTRLRGGYFTARGGNYAHAIFNHGSGATLDAEGVTVLGESGGNTNHGLYNYDNATATLRGGSFTGSGGGSSDNYGLFNYYGAAAMLHGGSFTARGGDDARAIYNSVGNATLEAESVTALAENGGTYNYGLFNGSSATTDASSSQFIGSNDGLLQAGGTVRLGVCQLDGEASKTGGVLTCFQVYTQTYTGAYTCP